MTISTAKFLFKLAELQEERDRFVSNGVAMHIPAVKDLIAAVDAFVAEKTAELTVN